MKKNIRVLIYPDETSGYNVECADLGAYSQGETLEEAMANMHEVIGLAIDGEDLGELGFVANPSLLVEIEINSALNHLGDTEFRRAG